MAVNLGYSSSQHLSNQFKKLTGMTPTGFKKIGAKQRKSLDSVKA
jgi:AraC-like DNA-binding protein